MIEVIPGILESDFSKIKQQVELVRPHVDWVEIDVLDNTLYPNDTYKKWEDFRPFASEVNLAAHLMVSDPAKYVQPLVDNGFKRLIADIDGFSIREFIHEARSHQVEVGVALNGPSGIVQVEPYLHEVDSVLLMTIKAGFSGQAFMPEVLTKIKKIREEFPDLPIQVDGGINKQTAQDVIEAGATRLISTSYLFWKNPHRIKEAIEELKGTTFP